MCGTGNGGEIWVQGWGGSDTVLNEGELPVVQTPTLVPRALFAGEAVLMVTCGGDFTAVATEAGSVYTFGFGGDGSLGHGDLDDQHLPRQVPPAAFSNERIVMVSAGHLHMVALSEARRVYTWGNGECFQLGNGTSEWEESPVRVWCLCCAFSGS
jgi:alpha-tubulin suppressor-like RCC1 family protein